MIILVCLVAVLALVSAEQPTVCSPTQCIAGSTNVTLGATFSSVILLPGTYSSTSPVASILPSLSSVSPTAESGIIVSPNSLAYPITVSLSDGALAFASPNYVGSATPIMLTSNFTSPPRLPSSLAISPNTAVTFRSASSSGSLVLFSSTPDTAQLPSLALDLEFLAVQSLSCTPACASGGACSLNGACVCAPGFVGSQCEQCAPGHFGQSCQQCEDTGCCEDGLTGSGKCFGAKSKTSAQTCGCERGTCGSNGSCTCNPGWADGPSADGKNATKCSVCAPGFFLDPSGECEVCSQGCAACATSSGICTTCQSSFTPDSNDRTRCVPIPASSTTTCPDGQFLDVTTGRLSTQCVACGAGQFMGPGGRCVAVDGGGVCQGTKLIANNAKGICDACPSTCTSCSIPSFSVVSTLEQVTCSACLPGFVLTPLGKCASACPAGTFVGTDGFTCTACDSGCAECVGSATFCTACANGGAQDGKCVNTCPTGTFLSPSLTPPATNSTTPRGNTCLACHPDCASCSGSGNTQCASCPPNRPVKTQDGRCLPASSCGAQAYFDTGAGTCKACDAGCENCVGAGSGMCSACAEGKVLSGGKCVDVVCEGGMVFGVCLSSLVVALPTSSKPTTASPLQIALASTGSLSLLVLGLLVWRRRARNRRAKETAAFADTLPDTKHKRWDWGRVWRMGEAQRRREQGWLGALGCAGKRRKEFHRELSLRRLDGSGSWRNRNMNADPDWERRPAQTDRRWRRSAWRSSDAESSVVFNRSVPLPPFSDRDSMDSRREDFWRDSIDERNVSGAYGGINPESHFAKTLAARKETPPPVVPKAPSIKSLAPELTGAKAITPNATGTQPVTLYQTGTGIVTPNQTGTRIVTPDQTGASAHTFGVSSSPLINLSNTSLVDVHQTGTSVAHSTGSSMNMHSGGKWMAPDFTGMASVPSHYTGMSGVSSQHTGTSSLASHYTGMSVAPRAPLPYAPFLSSSISNPMIPQPRQPIRDNSPFTINTALAPPKQNTNMLISPPPQGIPSSPVWPGAVGGSYWFSEEQQQQAQTKLGDKNPFRKF
ncbi:proprotein convertase subtilisin/kexin type 5 [Ceratobasidium sp. AG-Ba]|nr:proprotein convertase subtilisin/kexin type 5 [Ceratobasidium sp. AG-Ba]